jgi:hypothetical protein
MRQDDEIRVGVDVGSHAVRVAVVRPARGASVQEDGLLGPSEVLGAGLAESRGVVHGEVLDARLAARAIREAAEEAERAAGVRLSRAVLGSSGGRVETRALETRLALDRGRVEPWDPERARSALRKIAREPMRQRLLEQVSAFRLEGKDGEMREATDPVGLEGRNLYARAVALEADATPLASLAAAGRRAGLEVQALGWSPLAAALAATGAEERERGVVCLDLGAGTLGLAYFTDGRLRFASGRGPGGEGAEAWRWLRETLGGFLGSGILPRDLMPAGLVLSGGGGLCPGAASQADAELGLGARAVRLQVSGDLPGAAAAWAGAVGLARLLEASDALRRRTDTTRVPSSSFRPIAARLSEAGGAERLVAGPLPRGALLEIGIESLDDHPARPTRGQLCLLASEPWSGASALALQIALHAAVHRLEPTLLLTGDQGFKRTVLELAGIEARVSRAELLSRKPSRARTERFASALVRLSDAPLWVLDAVEDGVDDLASLQDAARAVQAELGRAPGGPALGLGLVVIDPVKALGPSMAWCGHALRALARELDAVVLAVADTGSLRGADPHTEHPEPWRLEDLGRLGDLGDAADVLWLARRDGMIGEEGGDQLMLSMATRPPGAAGTCVLQFDGHLLTGLGRAEPRRPDEAARTENARLLYDACEIFVDAADGLVDRYPDGVGEEQLLADPFLDAEDGDDWLRDMIRDALKRGYGGFMLGRVLVVRREGRLLPVDLGRLDTLFGPTAEAAARVLFEPGATVPGGAGLGALHEGGLDWVALTRLLARSARKAMSWGDGHLSDGAWLVRAPRPAGVLSLVFDLGARRITAEPPGDPGRLLRPEGYGPASLEFGAEGESVRALPAGAWLDPGKLAGLLAVLGATPADLGQVDALCRGPADPVLFTLGDVVRAALMPVRGGR